MESVAEVKRMLASADGDELDALMDRFADDERRGVQLALVSTRKRRERQQREWERLSGLYAYERELAAKRGGGIIVGIDEVGRGPLAGPLAAGAVVLDANGPMIEGLDDSKRLSSALREQAASRIREACVACAVAYVAPEVIDEKGITSALKLAFSEALAQVEQQGIHADVVLLDGNPVGFDEREVNVVKGDGKCASIAAASIIAKVERDHLMERLDVEHPGYGFADNKGYGSAFHLCALRKQGLSTVHRKSFCTKIIEEGTSDAGWS